MAKKSYSDKLKDPRWQKKRLEIFKRDKFRCKLCGDEETTLNVHHKKYENGKEPWEYKLSDLITLCEDCHKVVEDMKGEEDFNIDEIKLFKDAKWIGGGKIIWVSYNGKFGATFYDEDNNFIWGFIQSKKERMKYIIKIIKNAINGI